MNKHYHIGGGQFRKDSLDYSPDGWGDARHTVGTLGEARELFLEAIREAYADCPAFEYICLSEFDPKTGRSYNLETWERD